MDCTPVSDEVTACKTFGHNPILLYALVKFWSIFFLKKSVTRKEKAYLFARQETNVTKRKLRNAGPEKTWRSFQVQSRYKKGGGVME